MNQTERRFFLIKKLLQEKTDYSHIEIPANAEEQKKLLRSLFNVREPMAAGDEFLQVQDAYLKEEVRRKGITNITDLEPVEEGIYIWQGDITRFRCGAIVNAANAQMLGCFCPCHGCIDNAIHTYAGVQLRRACAEIMRNQGHPEKTGGAKITPAFNLPCEYVLHTVGPIISGRLTHRDEEMLASCYRSCLKLAKQNHIKSIAFCCISTGEFHFPRERAAEIAVKTVKENKSEIEVVFNVFKDEDYEIYRKLLCTDKKA